MQLGDLISSDRVVLAASNLNTKKDILLNAAAYNSGCCFEKLLAKVTLDYASSELKLLLIRVHAR